MATQKDAMLDVLLSVRDYVEQFETPNSRYERAKRDLLRLVNQRIATLNKQLDIYYAARKRANDPLAAAAPAEQQVEG